MRWRITANLGPASGKGSDRAARSSRGEVLATIQMNISTRMDQVRALFNKWIEASFLARPVLPSLLAFSVAWLLTDLFSHILWGGSLPFANPAVLWVGFLVPFLLMGAAAHFSTSEKGISRVVQALFVLGLVLVFLNVLVLHFPVMNYGDKGQLGKYLEKGSILARWLVGSSVLTRVYQSILVTFVHRQIIMADSPGDAFVRLSGSVVIIVSSVLILSRYPGRLSVLLSLTTPIWLLLSSGYSEFYPFIAPVFLGVLLFLSESDMQAIPPWVIGCLAASISLLYAGFIPIGLLILLVYTVRRGWRAGVGAVALAGLCALVLIVVLWPGTITNFAKIYRNELNLGEQYTYFPPYQGQAWGETIFFVPGFALSVRHLGDLFYMFFWGGGLSPLLIVVAGLFLYRRLRPGLIKDVGLVSVAILVIWQFVYFLLMIPKFGPRDDVDLFFSVYIASAFAAGLMIDVLVREAPPEVARLVRGVVFSICVGTSAFVLIYLMAPGIPAVS